MAGYIGGSQPVAFITDSIDSASLADDSVNSDEIAAGAVDLAHMSVNSIGADQYVDGSIATIHIADNAITSAKIGVDVIVAEDLAANSITVSELSDNAVTTAKIISQAVDESKLKADNNPTNDYVLTAKSSASGGLTWAETAESLPTQSGNSGEFLTTNGSAASWAELDTDANQTTKGLYEMANTISANYTISNNYNAVTAGPITVNNGISVTVPSGSTWVIL